MTDVWSVSTDTGTTMPAGELLDALASHHERVLASWESLSPEQWTAPSRNTEWTVHDTARHVADVMVTATAGVVGEPPPFSIDGFDPRTTPGRWMEASAGEDPAQTIERFSSNAPRYRERIGERLAAGEQGRARTVYGPAHWHLSVVHVFWDSWLHERDVLLALDRPAPSTETEQRLAALYGLLMTFVPAKLMGKTGTATIGCAGRTRRCITATLDAADLTSAEEPYRPDVPTGDPGAIVDALSGRGTPLRELLPDAPEGLEFFAAFMAGSP